MDASTKKMIFIFGSRAYLDVKELKEILKLDGSTHLNIFFANSSDEDLAGVATWPWDKEALTHLGTEKLLHKHSPGQEFELRSYSHLMLKITIHTISVLHILKTPRLQLN